MSQNRAFLGLYYIVCSLVFLLGWNAINPEIGFNFFSIVVAVWWGGIVGGTIVALIVLKGPWIKKEE